SGNHLYGRRDSKGNIVLNVQNNPTGRNGILELGAAGLASLRAIEMEYAVKLIREDNGQAIYVKDIKELPYVVKARLATDPSAPAGFRLVEATPGEENTVDAIFTQSGKKFLVEYSADTLAAQLNAGPAIIMHSDVTRIPVPLKDLENGFINYPDFYKFRPAQADETQWVNSGLLGEQVKLSISGKKDKATLVFVGPDGMRHLVSFSPEVEAYFDWADVNAYAYEIIPQKGAQLITVKDNMPTNWFVAADEEAPSKYPMRQNEILIVNKPRFTADYNQHLARISNAFGLDPKAFQDDTVFDLRNNSLVVYTEKGKDTVYFIRYKDTPQDIIVTEAIKMFAAAEDKFKIRTVGKEIIPNIITLSSYSEEDEFGRTYLVPEYRLEDFKATDDLERLRKEVAGEPERFMISGSVTLDYQELKSEGIDTTILEKILREYKAKGFVAPFDITRLKWVKITNYDPKKREVVYEYQAFVTEELLKDHPERTMAFGLPLVKIKSGRYLVYGDYQNEGNLIDIVFDYPKAPKPVSLRFDPDNYQEPVALSILMDYQNNLIIDLYRGFLYIESRDKYQGYLTKKVYLRRNGIFDRGWTWIADNLGDIMQHEKEREEIFDYQSPSIPASLIKALEIANFTNTHYNLNGKQYMIGKGGLENIDWEKGLVSSNNTIRFWRQNGSGAYEVAFDAYYKAWRDFKGNVRLQFFLQNGQPVSGIYIYDFNKYGIGGRSLAVVKLGSAWLPLKATNYENQTQIIRMRDADGNEHKVRIFLFNSTEINQPVNIVFNETELSENYVGLGRQYQELLNPELVKVKYKFANNGEGKLVFRLEGYDLDEKANFRGEPLLITFGLYSSDILDATEAGPWHFGYGKKSYT
ncbi:MAG: hypothetical protein PHG51_07685, partial [Candidatus Omnitrophica bacterium]|nr:hypothetical protein [Candidatus Omnitrophota bacterium]